MKGIVISVFAISLFVFLVSSLYGGNLAKAPGMVKLDSLRDRYESVIFDHPKHTLIAGDCGSCHHQHGDNGRLPCRDCHNLTPDIFKHSVANNFMACKNCHGRFNIDNPGMPSLKVAYHRTCFKCHRGMADLGIDPKGCTLLCHAKKVAGGDR